MLMEAEALLSLGESPAEVAGALPAPPRRHVTDSPGTQQMLRFLLDRRNQLGANLLTQIYLEQLEVLAGFQKDPIFRK